MIISYKANMAGPYHIETGSPCQDSFAIKKGRDSYIIAAVADGLGSELYSDIGSAVAASTAVDYCAERISEGMSFDEIKKIMNNAMVHAYKAVLTRAEQDTNDPDEYDTTLCLCAYNGERLYYGQSGDSGMVVLLQSGEYRCVTTQQRDEDGCVFPLCWGPDKWEFGYLETPVSSVMLMTDGVFEQVCPPVMRGKEIDINIPLARKFMDRFDCNEKHVTALESAAYRYLENYPRNLLDDDKTVVVIINTANPAKVMPETYYAVPNWKALHEEAEKKLVAPNDTVASDDITDDITPVSLEDQYEAIIQEPREDMSTVPAPHIDLDYGDKANDEVKKRSPHQFSKADVASSFKALAIAVVVIFSLLAWFISNFLKKHVVLTALGIFLTCFLSNASILLPSSSLLIAIEYSLIVNPIMVTFCAAAGASIGELTGFCVGRYGGRIIPRKLYNWLHRQVKRHGCLTVFVFSALPLPAFDVVGIIAGALKMKVRNFLTACFCGKLIKFSIYVFLVQWFSMLVK